MKRIFPNIQATLTQKYVTQKSFLRRFKRYWGTTTVNGVEVFNTRKIFYPKSQMDESTVKVAKLLGVYGSISGEMEGVRKAWFYLSVKKDETAFATPTGVTHTTNMNTAIAGLTSGSVLISSKIISKGNYQNPPILTDVTNQAGLIAEIKNNFQSYWDNDYTIFAGKGDDYASVFFMYLLRSSTIPFTIDKVEKIFGPISYPTSWDEDNLRVEAQPTWKVYFSFPTTVLTESTDIMVMLNDDLANSNKVAVLHAEQHLTTATTNAENTNGDPLYPPVTTYSSSRWLQVVDPVSGSIDYYLRASFIEDQSLSMTERINILTGCIDTTFRKKRASWFEMVLVVIIVILIVIYTWGVGSAAGAAAGGGAWGAVVTVAVTITLASMLLSLIAYALGAAGLTRMAGAMGEFLKTIEPLVRVASVVTLVNAFINVWRQVVAQATQAAIAEAGSAAVREITFTEVMVQSARTLIEQFTGITSLANMSFANAVKMMDFMFGIYSNDQTREMNRMIKNERAELAAWYEADEQAKTSDILKDFALAYPNLLSQDQSVYAGIYDRPYEWWSTPYHIGCMQANTVNALWLSRD